MGLDTLFTRANGQVIDQDFINLLNRVFQGSFVGRDSSGAPTAGQDLGTSIIPWGTARITDLILNGFPVDPGLVTAQPNRVVSGAVRPTSDFPDYLRPAGAAGGASFTVLGLTTDLRVDVNGVIASITTDIVKSGLTLAPAAGLPSYCVVNLLTGSGTEDTKFIGENGSSIEVNLMGANLTAKIGEFVALLNQTTSEILYCRVASATKLDYARRGFFFDSAGASIDADVLTNGNVLQLLSLGFIFAEDDGTTIDVTYTSPVISGVEPPPPPAPGPYWYDLAVNVWKRYSGSAFVEIDRTFIGTAVINYLSPGVGDCIGTRPEYFNKAYQDDNTLSIILQSVDVIVSEQQAFSISINGTRDLFRFTFFDWDASTDFESGFSRTVSRNYWVYITEEGKPIISGYKPYDLRCALRGWYHPYESWRCVGQVFNNAAGEFEVINKSDATLEYIEGVLLLPKNSDISNNGADPTNDIDFAPASFTFDDYTGEADIKESMTKQLDVPWGEGTNAGMLDTGSVANATYHLLRIYNPTTKKADYLASTSLTSPTMPSGYTKKRLIWSIIRAAGAILLFKKNGNRCILDLNVSEVVFAGAAPILRQTPTLAGMPSGRSVTALLAATLFRSGGAAIDTSIVFTNPDQTDETPSAAFFDMRLATTAGNPGMVSLSIQVDTNTNSQIGYRFSTAATINFQVNSTGWIDHDIE